MKANFVLNGLRMIVASLDRAIYYIISLLYDILGSLTSSDLVFNQDQISEFSARIYTFVGLVMLFKVTFSLISYLVNPDSLGDKTTGAGNIAKNVVITLFLIILVPYAFDFLYRAQNAIISDNIIPKLILGTTDDSLSGMEIVMDPAHCKDEQGKTTKVVIGTDTNSNISATGNYISIMALRPFYQIADDANMEDDMKTEYCEQANTINKVLSSDIYNATDDNKNYVIEYRVLLSTVCGIVVLLLLLTACMDIALRAIKLGFLELIAPVPIISYVDPKSGKDGMFKKWVQEVGRTWASLFVRLATIYFAIYIIQLVGNSNLLNEKHGIWITLFLIIGALMFAKQAPKLIEDIFGIKFDGLALSPIKKFKQQAAGGEALAKVPGKLGAAAIGGIAAGAGFAIGRNLKMKDIRDNQRSINADTKRLQQLRGKMLENRTAISDLKANGGSEAAIKQAQENLKNQQAEFVALNKRRHESIDKLKDAQAKYNKATTDDDGNRYFSAKHPGMAGVIQAATAATKGFKSNDIKGIGGTVSAGVGAAKAAVKRTNDFDRFSYIDRLKDLGTDLTGVKNESGTTSIVKDHLKQEREKLRDIESALRAQEVSFGNMSQLITLVDDEKGYGKKYVVAPRDSEVWNNQSISYDTAVREVEKWSNYRQEQRNTSKKIKEYEDVLAINSSKGK